MALLSRTALLAWTSKRLLFSEEVFEGTGGAETKGFWPPNGKADLIVAHTFEPPWTLPSVAIVVKVCSYVCLGGDTLECITTASRKLLPEINYPRIPSRNGFLRHEIKSFSDESEGL